VTGYIMNFPERFVEGEPFQMIDKWDRLGVVADHGLEGEPFFIEQERDFTALGPRMEHPSRQPIYLWKTSELCLGPAGWTLSSSAGALPERRPHSP
jgi:hypothetical protein